MPAAIAVITFVLSFIGITAFGSHYGGAPTAVNDTAVFVSFCLALAMAGTVMLDEGENKNKK